MSLISTSISMLFFLPYIFSKEGYSWFYSTAYFQLRFLFSLYKSFLNELDIDLYSSDPSIGSTLLLFLSSSKEELNLLFLYKTLALTLSTKLGTDEFEFYLSYLRSSSFFKYFDKREFILSYYFQGLFTLTGS